MLIIQWSEQSSKFYFISRMAIGIFPKKILPLLKANTHSIDLCRPHSFLVKTTNLVKMIEKLLTFAKFSKAKISVFI